MPVRIRASPRRYSRKLFTPFLLSFPPLPLPSPPIARPAGGRRKNRTLLSPLCSSFSLIFSEFSRSRYTCIGVLFVGFVQFFNCSRLYYNYSASNSCAKARKFRWNVGEKREREKSLGKRITLRVSVHVSKAAEIFRVLDSQYGSHFPQYRRFVR